MTMFSVRVEDDLAARFDAAATRHGGRSARLRQLIAEAASAPPLGLRGPAGALRSASARLVAASISARLDEGIPQRMSRVSRWPSSPTITTGAS